MDLASSTRLAVAYAAGISLLQLGLSLLRMILLARYLEPAVYAVYVLITCLPDLVNIIVSVGYANYLMRYLPRQAELQQIAIRVWPVVVRLLLAALVVSCLIILGFRWFSPIFQLEGYREHVLAYLPGLVAQVGSIYLTVALQARLHQRDVFWLRLVFDGLIVVVTAIGIAGNANLLFFLTAMALLELSRTLTAGFFAVKRFGPIPWGFLFRSPPQNATERSFRKVSYVNDMVASIMMGNADRYILAAVNSALSVATYNVALRVVGNVVSFLPLMMLKDLAPAVLFAKYDEHRDLEKLNQAFAALVYSNMLIGTAMIALFALLGQELLQIFFIKEYAAAYWPGLLLMTGSVFQAIPIGMIANAVEKQSAVLWSRVSVVINVVAGVYLAGIYGAVGIAAATAASWVLKTLIVYFVVKRSVDVRMPWLGMSKIMANGAIALLSGFLTSKYVGMSAGAIVLLLGYIAMNKVLSAFSDKERVLLMKVIPQKLQRCVQILT